MMILLSKKEYNDLVQKASGVEAQSELKAEEFKKEIVKKLESFIKDNRVEWRDGRELLHALTEILKQYAN